MWTTTGHLFVDRTVAVPAGHRLQHAAQEASVAVRLVLRAAGDGVNDSRENLQGHTNIAQAELQKICTNVQMLPLQLWLKH